MHEFTLRKMVTIHEETHHDGGPAPAEPRRKAAVLALVANPFAGHYAEELQPAMEALKPLGRMMTEMLIEALDGTEGIDSYGKGALVGEAGEVEHGALWHVPGGYAMRERLGKALAIVPSVMKLGGLGTTLDIPLGHINAAYVRSHFDAIELRMGDGPRADEIMFALAMAKGPRVHARMGGLAADEISRYDGLR